MPPDEVTADQRRYIKAVNFGLIYGMSAFGLAQQLDIERSAAAQFIEKYFARYPGVADYMQRTRETARANGYVETVFGRRLWLPDIKAAGGPRRAAAERAAINAPMQGTAADLIKLAMIAVQGWLDRERLAHEARPAGARRARVRGARGRARAREAELPGAHDRGADAIGAARGRRRLRRELGRGALRPVTSVGGIAAPCRRPPACPCSPRTSTPNTIGPDDQRRETAAARRAARTKPMKAPDAAPCCRS